MKRTVHKRIQAVANLLYLLCLATVFLMLLLVSTAHAGFVPFFNGPGDDIFKKRSAEIAHPEILDGIVGKIQSHKGLQSLFIMVSCLEEDGGKGLSLARASSLESFIKDRQKKKIPITTSSISTTRLPKVVQEQLQQSLAQGPGQIDGKGPGNTTAIEAMLGDSVTIMGEDGSTVASGNDEQLEAIDTRIKEEKIDWRRDLLRRYRKVLQTMADLCAQTIPYKLYENCSNLESKERHLCYQRVDLSRYRHDLEELTWNSEKMKLLHKQAKEVNGIVQEIVKHKPDVKAPVYDEKADRKAVEDTKLAVKYKEQAVETARYGLEYLQQIIGRHAISYSDFNSLRIAFKNREVPLSLYAVFVRYQSRNDFIEGQIALNVFIKRHLALRDCPFQLGFGCLPVCFEGTLGQPMGSTIANLTPHRLSKEEYIEEFRASRQEWIEHGIPELEFDIKQP